MQSDITDVNGEVPAYFRTRDTDYIFNVSQVNSVMLEKTFSPQKILASPITLTLGTGQIAGFDVLLALRNMHIDLTKDNTTKSFNMVWDASGVSQTTFTINSFCLDLQYRANGSLAWNSTQKQCKSTLTDSMTTSVVNYTSADNWKAVATVNITGSDPHEYVVDIEYLANPSSTPGAEVLFYAALLIFLAFVAASWNPAVAIVFTFLVNGLIITTGMLPLVGLGALDGVIVVGLIVMYMLKS